MDLMKAVKKNKLGLIFLIPVIVACITAATMNVIVSNTKEVWLKEGDKTTYVKTFKSTVGELLKEQNIILSENDYIEPSLDTVLEKEQNILIKRAVPVTVLVDGNEVILNTSKNTVQEVLEEANIQLNEKDEINYTLGDKISAAMQIHITRVTENIEMVKETLPFQVIKRANEKMAKDETRVVQEGAEGVKEKKYAIVYRDGKEVSRELIEDKIISQPVNKVIEYGTVATYKTSRGDVFRYKKVLNMRATAYDLSYESCGKRPEDPGYGITATGMKAKHGVVAVDPKVIPLHSRLYIEGANGSWTYGYAVAGDVGGGVNGNKIDLFFENPGQAKQFGVKNAKVYILE